MPFADIHRIWFHRSTKILISKTLMTSFRIIRRKEGGTKLHIENGIFTLCELNENYTKTKIKNQFQAKIQNETFRTEHNICRKS